jgi:hypothetical protein
MTTQNEVPRSRLGSLIVAVLLLLGLAYGGWQWNEMQAMNELVSPGMHLINYTNDEVYTSVHYSKFPNPGEGVSYDMGPNSGGAGLMCCVPIPTHWRPGIKMIVKYRFGRWPDGMEETKITELPEYPGGEAGDLYLVFHSTTEFELLSTNFAPGHPRWPGKQVEPVIKGLEK